MFLNSHSQNSFGSMKYFKIFILPTYLFVGFVHFSIKHFLDNSKNIGPHITLFKFDAFLKVFHQNTSKLKLSMTNPTKRKKKCTEEDTDR